MGMCKNCGYGPLAIDAIVCPRCVQDDPNPSIYRILGTVGMILGGVLGLLGGGLGGGFVGLIIGGIALPLVIAIVVLIVSIVVFIVKIPFVVIGGTLRLFGIID